MNKAMAFTQTEKDFLAANGWEVTHGGKVAEKDWRRIVKLFENDFEVQTCIMDPDSNDYWEFDSEWVTIEQAVRRA